jgi:hypothetical protein
MAARATAEPYEPTFQDAAVEKSAELPLDESRDRMSLLTAMCEKAFQFAGDHGMQNGFFGAARRVLERRGGHASLRRSQAAVLSCYFSRLRKKNPMFPGLLVA